MKVDRPGLGIFVVVAIVAAVGLSVGTVAASSGDAITVNCDGDSGQTIQGAVDSVDQDHRTVEVCDGVYEENVTVPSGTNDIEIVVREGHDAVLDGTTEDSDANGFTVEADDVHIQGFAIRDFGGDAIFVEDASAFSVNESVMENNDGGIHVAASDDQIVGLTIHEVAILDNDDPLTVEAEGASSEIRDVEVRNVAIENNTNRAVFKARNDGLIEGLTIERTAAVESGASGLAFGAEDGGTMADVTVTESLFADNAEDGLALRSANGGALTGVTVTEVAAQNNHRYGVVLDVPAGFEDVTIQDSLVRDNDFKGVFSRADGDLADEELNFSYNVIEDNAAYGVFQEADGDLDATLNYWGANDGPSSPDGSFEDPVYTHIEADGSGDAISGEAGTANVSFAPALGAKNVCDDAQLQDLVPDDDFEVTIEGGDFAFDADDRSFSYQVDNVTIAGPTTRFVGACAWERLPFPLRATGDSAATSVPTGDNIFVEADGEILDLNRPDLNVYQEGDEVDLTYGPDSQADTARFAGRDAQLVVARVADEGADNVDLEDVFDAEFDAERGDASIDTDLLEFVHVQDTTIGGSGLPQDDLAFTPSDDGVYVAALTVLRTGDGFTGENDGSLTTNVHETDLTVAGAEIFAVQEAESGAEPTSESVEPGDEVDFTLDANFTPTGDVGHAVVLYHEDQFLETQVIARFDGDVDFDDLVLDGGEFTLDLNHDHASDSITVAADGPFDTLVNDVTVSGDFTVVDSTAGDVVGDGSGAIVTLTVGEDFAEGEYRYVHVATDEDGTFSTTTDTLQVEAEEEEEEPGTGPGKKPGKGPGTGPGGPPSTPPPSTPSPVVKKTPPDRIDVEVPGAVSRSFGFDLPATDSMNESGVHVTRIDATSLVGQDIDITIDTSRAVPGATPGIDSDHRTGHLYLDIGYDVDADVWESSTFEWRASKQRFGAQDPDNFQLFRYDAAADEWEAIDTEFVEEDDDGFVFRSEADGFSVYAFSQSESDFEVTGASLSEDEIQAGETVDVRATVENRGEGAGTFTAELRVDGDVVRTQAVTLGPDESEEITFTETFEDPGTYDVQVNDASAGTLEVTEAVTPTPEDEDEGIGMLAIVLLILLIMALVGAGVYVYTMRQQGEDLF